MKRCALSRGQPVPREYSRFGQRDATPQIAAAARYNAHTHLQQRNPMANPGADHIHHITPGIGVDDISIGDTVAALLASGYEFDPPVLHIETRVERDNYTKHDGKECVVENDAVTGIICASSACYQGMELIGRNQQELIAILGQSCKIGEALEVWEGIVQTPCFYHDLGLTIWLQEGVTVSVWCHAIVEGD